MISIKQVNSLYIILASFVVALIIILMIYDSNLTTLENKISATANPNAEQPQVSNESAMQMMESIQTLMKALAEDPDNYNLNVQAANANFDISRFDKAAYYYNKALSLHDHDANVEIDLGVCYFNLGKMDSALIYMKSAIDKNPQHKQGLYNIGVVYFNIGQKEKAVEFWKKLVELYPESNEGITAKNFINEVEKQNSGI